MTPALWALLFVSVGAHVLACIGLVALDLRAQKGV